MASPPEIEPSFSGPEPGSDFGGVEGQKPAEFGQAAGTPDWGMPSGPAGDLGSLTGTDHPQPSFFPDVPFVGPEQNSRDVPQSPANGVTGDMSRFQDVKPIAGGAPNSLPEDPKQGKDNDEPDRESEIWSPGRTDIVYGDLRLNRDEDLSYDANWLVEELLAGARDYGEELDYLQWHADNEGIDLQAAMTELDGHRLLVSRKPGWIDLPRKVIPSKDRGKK